MNPRRILVICVFAALAYSAARAAHYTIKAGSTDVTVYVTLFGNGDKNGAAQPITGIAFNNASLKVYYIRPGGSLTQISTVTQTVTGAYADGGWVELSSTNAPGRYHLDLPDGVVASGVPRARVMVYAESGASPIKVADDIDLDLVGYDPTLANLPANVTQVAGQTATVASTPIDANVTKYGGTNGSFSGGRPEINLTFAGGTAIGAAGTGYGPLLLATTIKSLNGGSQTNLELNNGVSAAGSYVGYRVLFRDATGSSGSFSGVVTAYATNASALQYTPDGTPSFTLATNDIVEILPP